ncbi:MAG: biopolymer transporter ExbD [Pirellulaceae bacterium]
MPLKTRTSEELPSVNLTPMIDVVFLLIIFFMVGTQFTESERQIDIQLPSAGNLNAMIAAPGRREVVVSSDGSIYLDGQPLSTETLTQRLREMRMQYPDLRVAVRADGDAMQKHVVPVYGALNAAGVDNFAVLGVNHKLR